MFRIRRGKPPSMSVSAVFSRRCQDVNERALSLKYIHSLMPGLKKTGHELKAGDIYGNRGKSFSINTQTYVWSDFNTGQAGGDIVSLVAERDRITQGEALEKLEKELGLALPEKPGKELPRAPISGAPSRQWVYTDGAGFPLYEARRWEKEGFRKSCRLYNPDDHSRVPLYLPEVDEAVKNGRPIFVVEGEPKADLIRSWGQTATTFAGGANGYNSSLARYFEGASVVILPDADRPGREFAAKLASDISRLKNKG